MSPLKDASEAAINLVHLAWLSMASKGESPNFECLSEALSTAQKQLGPAIVEQLIRAKRDDTIVKWGTFTGVLAHEIAINFGDAVLLEAEAAEPNWERLAGEFRAGDPDELIQRIHLEYFRGAEHEPAPVLMTIKQIHKLATELAPVDAKALQTYRNVLPRLATFQETNGREKVVDYHEILPKLREKWPEISWPTQLSPRE